MPQFTKYAEGQFCWVDLSTTDIAKSVPFYCELFGWTSQLVPEPEAGGYTFFLKDGKHAAAAAPSMDSASHWNTSVTVADIDKDTRRCEEAGATVLAQPMKIGTEGSFSAVQDPSGAVLYLWQPENMIGATVASEANTWVWSILNCRDVPAAKQFYKDTFGYETSRPGGADIGPYEEFGLNGIRIGGLVPMPDEVPKNVPSFWSVIFAVENCAQSTDKAKALGAEVWMSNDSSMPGMTFSGLNDPTGGGFTIVQMG